MRQLCPPVKQQHPLVVVAPRLKDEVKVVVQLLQLPQKRQLQRPAEQPVVRPAQPLVARPLPPRNRKRRAFKRAGHVVRQKVRLKKVVVVAGKGADKKALKRLLLPVVVQKVPPFKPVVHHLDHLLRLYNQRVGRVNED